MPIQLAYDGILPSSVRKRKKYGIVFGICAQLIVEMQIEMCKQDKELFCDHLRKGHKNMKKQILTAFALAAALTLAGCSSSKKETEAPAPETQAPAAQSEAAAETQAAVAETEAAAAVVETEAAVVETEAEAAVVETEAEAVVVETEAVVVETEAEAAVVETEAEAVVVETEAEAVVVETEAEAAVVETEAETVETEEEIIYIDALGDETEDDYWETEDDYDYWETESEYDFYFDEAETETEAEMIPRPDYEESDYLTINDDAYKNLTIQVPAARKVTEEEIDADITDSFYYLEDYDDLIIKKTEGTIQEGDTVNIDYVGTKDGEAFEGGTAEGYDLEIGSGSFIPGFEEGLVGKEIGSTVDLNLTFPEDYGVEDLNGADVVFTVTINYVVELPEITDEIAQKLSDDEYKTVDEYRESIRAELQTNYDDEYKETVSNALLNKLLETYPVSEYPQANVDYNVNMIVSQYITPYASMYGMSDAEFVEAAYGMEYDVFVETELVPYAKQTVAQEIILGVIAEKEGITMTDEELEERLQGYADQYGIDVEELVEGQDMGYIRKNELDQRVLTWLRENVAVEEIAETEAMTAEQTEAETDAAQTEAQIAETETEA